MKVKMTAMRRGFTTQARWINIDEDTNTVVSVIDNGDREIYINNINDLLKFYTPLDGYHNLPSAFNMFNNFQFKEKTKTREKPSQNKDKQRNMHEELMEGFQALNDEREGKKELKKHYMSQDHSKDEPDLKSLVYDLVRYENGKVQFSMEFESFDDLKEHYRSMIQRYPNSEYEVYSKEILKYKIDLPE